MKQDEQQLGEVPATDGGRLRYWRRAAGVQRRTLAKILECDESLLSKIERDEVELGLGRARVAARALGITISLLMGEHDPEQAA